MIAKAKRKKDALSVSADDPFFFGLREHSYRDDNGKWVWDPIPLTEEDVLFPQEGDHISNNALHDDNRDDLKRAIRWRIADRKMHSTYVLSDHLLDFELGFRSLAPDTFVFTADRPWDPMNATYPVKKESAQIHFIVEFTSPSTRDKDLDDKVEYYAKAGVPQYVILDNRIRSGTVLPSWIVYRWSPDGMVRVPLDRPNHVYLPAIDLWLTQSEGKLECLLPDGSAIPDFVTAMNEVGRERAEKEKERAEKEKERAEKLKQKARADALETELAQLKRQRGES